MKKKNNIYNILYKIVKLYLNIFGYFMILLFSLLFMEKDIIFGLNIFFSLTLILTSYYFIWCLLFKILKNKK